MIEGCSAAISRVNGLGRHWDVLYTSAVDPVFLRMPGQPTETSLNLRDPLTDHVPSGHTAQEPYLRFATRGRLCCLVGASWEAVLTFLSVYVQGPVIR